MVLVLLLRRPPRAVHPGIAVGLDLVLWLTFIFTLLFTITAVLSLSEFGTDASQLQVPYYGYGSNAGSYSLAPNNSWVYVPSTDRYYYNGLAKETGAASSVSTATSVSVIVTVASTTMAIASTTPAAVLPAVAAAAKRAVSDGFHFSSGQKSSASYYPYNSPYDSDYPYDSTDPYDSTYSDSYNDPYTEYSTDSNGFYIFPTSTATRNGFGGTGTVGAASSTSTRDCTPEFASCEQQDAFVNSLWHDKPRRYALDMLAAIIQGLAIILHFTLFVWACVDTHRRNRLRRTTAMTMDVLVDMRQRGYVMVPAAEAGGAPTVALGGIPGQGGAMYPYPPPPQVGAMGPGAPYTPGMPPSWPAAATTRAGEKAPAEPSSMPRYS